MRIKTPAKTLGINCQQRKKQKDFFQERFNFY